MQDLIFTHANILMLDDANTRAEAVAIKDGLIAAVGRNDDVLNFATPNSRIEHLNGATVLPGFIDAHCHVLHFGFDLASVNLASPPVIDIPALLRLLQERADAQSDIAQAWVRGRGYDQNKLTERRHPTRHDLDKIGSGKPFVLLSQTSGHAVSVNSRVLEKAGITRTTPDPAGGTIMRDANGEPTGVLLENAMDLVYAIVPESTHGDKVAALQRAGRELHALGITSAADASTSLSDIAAYRQAAGMGALTVRCTLMLLIQQLTDGDRYLTPHELKENNEGPYLRIGPAKLFSDGALTTRTALLRAPFADDSRNYGTAMWETEWLNAMIGGAHAAGWQIAAHAIGDRAIDLCLDALERALADAPRTDARHRIEHAMLLWDDQIARMVRSGILPIYQPEFIAQLGDAYITGLGRDRANRLLPYRSSMQAGLPLIFSSDLPVVPGDPLVGIASALQRRTPNGEVLDARQCVSVTDALHAYTSGAAYSLFAESEVGHITPGLCADLIILNTDPTALPPDEWPDALQIQATLVGGKVVYGEV